MFLKSFIASHSVYRKYAISGIAKLSAVDKLTPVRTFGYTFNNIDTLHSRISVILSTKCQVQRHYSRSVHGDILDPQNELKEKDRTDISSLFPNGRVTLYEMASRCPSKVFDIHYKQSVVAPRGAKKKTTQNDWMCTYAFEWPQKIKFEGTALSKRQAAENAAQQALHWLYVNKRINKKGNPIFDESVIEELDKSIQETFKASISTEAMEKIDNIWDDYENGISDIYKATFEAAKYRLISTPTSMTKDSTIDEDDELSDDPESPDTSAETAESKIPVHPVYCKHVPRPTETALDRRKRQLMKTFEVYDDERTPLPIDEYSRQTPTAGHKLPSKISTRIGLGYTPPASSRSPYKVITPPCRGPSELTGPNVHPFYVYYLSAVY